LQIRIDRRRDKEGYVTVAPQGSIDTDTHDEFRRAVEPVLAGPLKGLLLDLERVEYISSAGLGVLFSMQKAMDKIGAELVFCHAKPQIQKLFETIRFLPKERIFRSLDEADRYFYDVMNREIERQKKPF
jgi:anti-sigma B factor antagonist